MYLRIDITGESVVDYSIAWGPGEGRGGARLIRYTGECRSNG